MMCVAMRLRGFLLALFLPLALVACGTPRVLELSQAPKGDVAGTVQIYVATTREASAQPVYFSGERGPKLSFARLDITVPRSLKSGNLELPDSGPGDPAKHFAANYIQKLDLAHESDVNRRVKAVLLHLARS